MGPRRLRVRNQALAAGVAGAALTAGSWEAGVGAPWILAALAALGAVCGALYARGLWARALPCEAEGISRVPVPFVSLTELALTAIASPAGLAVLAAAAALAFAIGALGGPLIPAASGAALLGAGAGLGVGVARGERRRGALYREHDTHLWSGAEGMRYARARVVERLAPWGRVRVEGEFWRARSSDGRAVEPGETVEVRGVDGLTLRVHPMSDTLEADLEATRQDRHGPAR